MHPFHPACLYAHYGMEREDFCLKTLALIIEMPIFPPPAIPTCRGGPVGRPYIPHVTVTCPEPSPTGVAKGGDSHIQSPLDSAKNICSLS